MWDVDQAAWLPDWVDVDQHDRIRMVSPLCAMFVDGMSTAHHLYQSAPPGAGFGFGQRKPYGKASDRSSKTFAPDLAGSPG